MTFYIVDAFSVELFGGNPAGVVMVGEKWPGSEVMAKTAAELRYSESAFVQQTGTYAFHTRYFAPAGEVDLCGHATVGAFCALAKEGLLKPGSTYTNLTRAGLLDVILEDDGVYMTMAEPQSPLGPACEEEYGEVYRICGISAFERPCGMNPEVAAAGMPDIMLPVKNRDVLARIAPNFSEMAKLSARYGVAGVHAFCPAGSDGKVHCRNFAPLYGIDEEAATGTANGALTWYLYRNGLLKNGDETVFIQGEAMNRPSVIRSRLSAADGKVKIMVGGTAAVLSRGEIFI